MLKMVSESFFSCFVVILRSFSENFSLGTPAYNERLQGTAIPISPQFFPVGK